MFEISFVDHDDPFYQVHNVPGFLKLKVRTFEYSSEDMDTGIAEIDAIETDNSLDAGLHQLSLEDGTGSLLSETGHYIILETYKVDTIDENAMNDFFETADDTVLDFTESNPFGDIGRLDNMLGQQFYHGNNAKMVIAFGTMFNDIHLVRTNNSGMVTQTMKVPLAYGLKTSG